MRIDYERGSDVVTRVLGPLGLVLKGGVWYLVALSDGQIRTYRVSRIVERSPLDGAVERPAGFDLATYWSESSAAYERDSPASTWSSGCRRPVSIASADAVGWHAIETAERPRRARARRGSASACDSAGPTRSPAASWPLGSSVEVLEPSEVRERVIATARRIVERYEPVETRGDVVPPPDGDIDPAPLLRPADASATGS